MARLLQIAQLGHPVLRKRATDVEDVQNPQVHSLIDDMLLTVSDANGVGIAAPQVYESKRIFIISSRPNPRYPYAPEMEPTTMINPEIIGKSLDTEKDWEGCLTIPGVRGLVPRHKAIAVSYVSDQGETVETKYSGFIARVFQHEFDHLEGIVFLDRLESTKDIVMEKEWLKMIAQRESVA
ncbi:MAG: peptide deformylase [bacterium]|nr:peptide deformylase [bacterium]